MKVLLLPLLFLLVSSAVIANSSSITSLASLLSQKYNQLLIKPITNSSQNNEAKQTLKTYQTSILNSYRKNQSTPSNVTSGSNIDNGANNSIVGELNVVREGDFNSIEGNSNTINGSNNTINGNRDFVQGNGNLIISDPQSVDQAQKQIYQTLQQNSLLQQLFPTSAPTENQQNKSVIQNTSSSSQPHLSTQNPPSQDNNQKSSSQQSSPQGKQTSNQISKETKPQTENNNSNISTHTNSPSDGNENGSVQGTNRSSTIVEGGNSTNVDENKKNNSTITDNKSTHTSQVATNWSEFLAFGFLLLLTLF